ncbi:GNAT family N-acetyltransferase [Polynucleobacter necessarius]|uniref:GNAT family N-acetyltransferase n=1 Tax=Polynucleobacter necessarius TaxID=576610 RepID=UPI000E09CE44|nr:GNAT family N-acetyltransferase [Polynucleobacter necessarius]
MKNIDILLLSWKDAASEAFSIRKAVFIEEQNVPEELELDEFDAQAMHALLKFNNQSIGTARLVDLPNGQAQIGRMAVLPQYRGQGFGKQILVRMILAAREKGITSLMLHSQVSAVRFYEKLGFIAQGAIYDEAGIPHRNMMLELLK